MASIVLSPFLGSGQTNPQEEVMGGRFMSNIYEAASNGTYEFLSNINKKEMDMELHVSVKKRCLK